MQVALVYVAADGAAQPMGEPGLIADARPFPDGRAVLVEHVHEPFSYLVPACRCIV